MAQRGGTEVEPKGLSQVSVHGIESGETKMTREVRPAQEEHPRSLESGPLKVQIATYVRGINLKPSQIRWLLISNS